MKSIAIGLLRHLFIPVGFIWSTGIISTFSSIDFSDKAPRDAYHTFTDSELATLEINPANAIVYCDTLIATRTRQVEQTGYYSPMDYFHDLKQLRMFETVYKDSLDRSTMGRFIYMNCASPMGATGKLCNLRDGKQKVSWDQSDLENARHYWFPLDAIRDAELKKNPPEWWRDLFSPISGWMLRVYLRGLPFALLLLLIWRKRVRKDCEEINWQYEKITKPKLVSGFAPLSLLISLSLWPIILYLDIRSRIKETLYRAELASRRSEVLYLFSAADQKLLETGKKMSLREFRAYLESIGKVRKHSFIFAIAITVLLSASPQVVAPVIAIQTYTETTVSARRVQTDHDVGKIPMCKSAYHSYEAIMPHANEVKPEITQSILYFYFVEIGRILKGFATVNDGVPKAANQFRLKMIS